MKKYFYCDIDMFWSCRDVVCVSVGVCVCMCVCVCVCVCVYVVRCFNCAVEMLWLVFK